MDPFETMKALGQMWGQGGEAFLKAQGDAFGAMSKAAGGDLSGFAAVAGPDAEAMEKARAAFETSWAAASALSASIARAGRAAGGAADGKTGEILDKIFDPKGWFSAVGGMDEGVARMVDGPRLADLWNMERKFAAVFAAWLALRRRTLEHQTLMLDVWTRSAGQFAKMLNEKSLDEKTGNAAGDRLGSWRDVMPLWIEIANDQLIEAQRSEAFLASQREMLKASTDLKLAQQEVAAFYSDTFGYPTRAELDDVHRALTDLKREVRGDRRARRIRKSEGAGA